MAGKQGEGVAAKVCQVQRKPRIRLTSPAGPLTNNRLALALLMLRVFTNHANHAATMDHLALVTNFLYGRTNLHKTPKALNG